MTNTRLPDPYLLGRYAPVAEEATIDELTVRGRLPEALSGRYLRTGPNPMGTPGDPYHWFVGDGMVHGLTIDAGRAGIYRNRWVRTDDIADRLGEPRTPGPAQPFYDSSNTNVIEFAGRILSLTEGCHPYVLDDDLATLRREEFGAGLPHGLTAHPKHDPVTGELHGFATWWEEPKVSYHRFSADGRLVQTEDIDLAAPVSMHDFAFTANHIVFFDQPAVLDLGALTGSGFPYRWQPDNGSRIGLLPRHGSAADVRWIDAPLGYSFHIVNAYETDDTIVIDLPLIPNAHAGDDFDTGAREFLGLQRWTIDVDGGRLSTALLDDLPQEFGRVPDSLVSRPHRFAYTLELGVETAYDRTRVMKHDLISHSREDHDFGPGNHPGEFVFVPDPDRDHAEDGGWLMGFVHHDGENRTTFALLDAQAIEAAPVAEVVIPRRVPHGFHGNWVPS